MALIEASVLQTTGRNVNIMIVPRKGTSLTTQRVPENCTLALKEQNIAVYDLLEVFCQRTQRHWYIADKCIVICP